MSKYLVDVNLPYRFSLWCTSDFLHQKDINDTWRDSKIWLYAKENKLTIISKGSDFSNRILLHEPPPRVIHIRFGNMRMTDFTSVISECWNDVVKLSNDYKLVTVYRDRIEGIN